MTSSYVTALVMLRCSAKRSLEARTLTPSHAIWAVATRSHNRTVNPSEIAAEDLIVDW